MSASTIPKASGGIYSAFRKLRRDNQQDTAHLHSMLDSFENDIRHDVQCVHAAVDRTYHLIEEGRTASRRMDRQAMAVVVGIGLVFTAAAAAASYDIYQHRRTAQEITAHIDALPDRCPMPTPRKAARPGP